MFKLLSAITLLAVLTVSPDASAQADGVAGSYDVTISSVANSCKQDAIELGDKQTLRASIDVKNISLQLRKAPELRGPLRNRGRFKAKGKQKVEKSATEGNFSATGRANNGSIRLVLVAEFFKDGKALCTQSWNIVGKRQ